jgi:hypothetical protein
MNDHSRGGNDVKYLMLIRHPETFTFNDIPQSLMDAMGELVERNMKSGVLLDTAGLKRSVDGFRVRLSKGQLSVTDGPFTETKEVVGGYAIVQASSRDQALAVAREFMDLHRIHWPSFEGECEVRPFENP